MTTSEFRVISDGADAYPCCMDHTSIEGLAPLIRERPRDWHELVEGNAWPDASPDTTLGEYLREGGGGLLVPKSARDTSIKKKRCGARRVTELLGHLVVAELGEDDLLEARRWYEAERGPGASSGLVSADMRVFRQAVHRAQVTLGAPRVRQSWGGPRPAQARKAAPRPTPTPPDVRQLLEVSGAMLAMAIALIVGCGLLPSELMALRVRDLNPSEAWVWVYHRGVRGWGQAESCRAVRVPDWAWQLVKRALPGLARMPKDALLFCSPRDPSQPWTSLGRSLRRAAVRAGLQAKGARDDRWTPLGLRRLYQDVARKLGLPRALVRGTVVVGMVHSSKLIDAEIWLRQSDRLALFWTHLLRPPGYIDGARHHVPRRAPAKVRPLQPEWPNQRTKRWLEERDHKRRLPSGCDVVPGNTRRKRTVQGSSAGRGTLPMPSETRVVRECIEAAAQAAQASREEAARADGFGAGILTGGTVGLLVGLNLAPKENEEKR